MAGDKFQSRIEAKIDAIIEKLGIKPEDIKLPEPTSNPAEIEAAMRQAQEGAPKTPAASIPQNATETPAGVANAPVTPATETSAETAEAGYVSGSRRRAS